MKFGKLGAKRSEYWNLSYNDDIPESLATRMSGRQDLISLADLSLILETINVKHVMKIGDLIERNCFNQ
jgi:hypothetical protein